MLFINKVLFVKKNLFTQVELVTKIKKHNQLYFGTLVLTYCCCRDNGFLAIHWLQRKQQHVAWKSLEAMINFHEKQCLSGITQNKKHWPKQVVAITYTLKKRVLAAGTFKGLWVVSFQTKWENAWYTLVCLSLFCISRGKKTK